MPMKRKREFRNLRQSEIRAGKTDDGKLYIEGYAAVFDQPAEIPGFGGGFTEIVRSGCFARALKEKQDVRALFNHDSNFVLGRSKSGTLEMREDGRGLFFRDQLPDTQPARDLHASIERGDIDGCSFGFRCTKQNWIDEKKDGKVASTRELIDVDLFDIGPVTYPAYTETSVAARSMFPDGVPNEIRSHVRTAGMSGDDCECDCPECQDDNCAECSNPDCTDENCDGHPERNRTHAGEQRDAPTKKVDGKELHASDFAHVGDAKDTSTWKLPIHDAAHVRNALARFNQVKGLSQDEKDAAWKKVLAAAKKFDIKVSEENSAKLLAVETCKEARAIVRSFDPDGDGDDDEPLIDALIDARNGCGYVSQSLSAAIYAVFDGETGYAVPLLKSFIEQAAVLAADLQEAIDEAKKEIDEPPAAEENSAAAATEHALLRVRTIEASL